jgi:hypothetical protein
MGAVGGSRHYTGGGLGNESGWKCPACGAENAGPIAGGCTLCGAGRPGYRVGENQPPPPPPQPAAPEPEPPPAAGERVNLAQLWIQRHPDATLEEAFTAGYVAGIKVARSEVRARHVMEQPHPLDTFAPEHLVNRTIIAALELFRDQILVGEPEEVRSGEWLSATQVTELLQQLRAHVQQSEVAHA